MGKGLARLIGSGIGFTSEAIHAARRRNTDSTSASNSKAPRSLPGAVEEDDQYVVADSERPDALIDREITERSNESKVPGYLELPVDDQTQEFAEEKRENHNDYVVGEENGSVYYRDDVQRSIDEDEAAWQLDEAAEQWGLPAYEEVEYLSGDPAAQMNPEADPESEHAPMTENDSEETKEKKRDAMVRALVQMAGPPGPVQRLPCPVIIPQRRPGAKKRGFVRAYAPVLADCGISQDVFVKFISDFHKASQASLWLQVIVVAANVTGFSPSLTVALTAIAIQIVAETAMQFQIRHRTNSYLDKVNQELFMPRGQYAMVMKFKEHNPSQKQESSGSFSDMLGSLFSTEKVDVSQSGAKSEVDPTSTQPTKSNILEFNAAATISKFTHSEEHPEMNAWTKKMKHYRDVSGRTHGALELPECAPLIFPDIDRAAMRVREGKEPKSKFQSGRTWVRDYIDRKSQAEYEAQHKGSALAVPESGRKAFTSRYNDPNHPANNGKLLSALTGGLYNPKPGLIERAGMAIKESQDKKRAAQGLPPSESWKDMLRRKKKEQIGRLKILQEDVIYLMIVNMPTEEELKESVAELRHLMETEGRTLPPGHSRR